MTAPARNSSGGRIHPCLHRETPQPLSLLSWGVVGIPDPVLGGKLYCEGLRQVPAHTQLTQKELL